MSIICISTYFQYQKLSDITSNFLIIGMFIILTIKPNFSYRICSSLWSVSILNFICLIGMIDLLTSTKLKHTYICCMASMLYTCVQWAVYPSAYLTSCQNHISTFDAYHLLQYQETEVLLYARKLMEDDPRACM